MRQPGQMTIVENRSAIDGEQGFEEPEAVKQDPIGRNDGKFLRLPPATIAPEPALAVPGGGEIGIRK